MKYQAILFDMDGTLLDTLTDMQAAVNHILEKYGYPTRTLEEVRRFVGNGAGPLIHRALPQGVDPDREAEILADYRAYYQAHNCVDRENRYHVLIRLAMDPAALAAYDVSPMHHRWKDRFGPLLEKKAIFDFEE